MQRDSVFSRSDAPSTAPVDSATVVVLREAEGGPEVLLLKRHANSRFMAGAFVFPGGRVDVSDGDIPVSAEDRAWCRAQLDPTLTRFTGPEGEARAASFYVAAARELFEEAGVLLVKNADGSTFVDDEAIAARLTAARRRLNANETTFATIVQREKLMVDVRGLQFWSHWITPRAERRRYDTRFFVAWLPDGQWALFDDIETTEQVWMKVGAALAAHHLLRLFLAPPQQRTLEELAPFEDRDALVAEAPAPDRAVPPILPQLVVDDEGIRILLPWDEAYVERPGEDSVVAPLARQARAPSRIRVRRPLVEEGDRAQAILHFWYGDGNDGIVPGADIQRRWWRGGPDFDRACRAFEADHRRAVGGELDDWRKEPQRDLARILLLDQLSRNLFRGTPRAFAQDARAQQWVLEGLAVGTDQQLPPMMRWFYYMPLVHAEDRELQRRHLGLFDALVATVPPAARSTYEGAAESARRHQRIIERFGRFPHRNEVLGRESTPEERAFLEQPGSRF